MLLNQVFSASFFSALLTLAHASLHDSLKAKAGSLAGERCSGFGSCDALRPQRQMVAARSTPGLQARHEQLKGFLKYDHVLPFIDGMVVLSLPGPRLTLTIRRSTGVPNGTIKSRSPITFRC
jgi:hypothetical protein